MVYLDANATEPLRPEARQAAIEAMDLVGNPASIHAAGRAARRVLEEARRTVAAVFGAASADVIFTSGGTEANALAISGLSRGRKILAGATEHDAVLAAAPHAVRVPVHQSGEVDLDALHSLLKAGPPSLVCLMLANNETGVLHPIPEAASICHAHGAWLHVDAVQAAGRIPTSLNALGADSLALSAHKMGGPKGAGALVLAPNMRLEAAMPGGGQEKSRRGGTPSLPAIAGFAAAAKATPQTDTIRRLRDRAEHAATEAGAVVCGTGRRLPNTTCLALPGKRAETQVIALDLAGIAVSAGAACSSGKVTRSHVLDAMGLTQLADTAIRVSIPWNATDADLDQFLGAYLALALGRALGKGALPP